MRRGRRAGGVWQARNPRNSTLWRHFVRKAAINTRIRSFGGSGAAAVDPQEAGLQRRIPFGEPHKLDIMATFLWKNSDKYKEFVHLAAQARPPWVPKSRSPEVDTTRVKGIAFLLEDRGIAFIGL